MPFRRCYCAGAFPAQHFLDQGRRKGGKNGAVWNFLCLLLHREQYAAGEHPRAFDPGSPFGDGKAGEAIVDDLLRRF